MKLIKCEFIKNYTFPKVLLILVVLLISSIIVSETSVYPNEKILINPSEEIEIHERGIQELINSPVKSLKKDFMINQYQRIKNTYQLVKDNHMEFDSASWQYTFISHITNLENRRFVISQMIENPDEEFVANVPDNDYEIISTYDEAILSVEKNRTLEEQQKELEDEIKKCEEILKENKFYKYIEYRLERFQVLGADNPQFHNSYVQDKYSITEENKKDYEFIVREKVESEKDIRTLNLIQKNRLSEENVIVSEKEFKNSEDLRYEYSSYDAYVRYYLEENKKIDATNAIVSYAYEHNIKHDLKQEYSNGIVGAGYYMTTKVAVNKIFHLSVVVLALVILTSAGIISHEHTIKTDKALLTSPMKRGKVLFCKFIYLIMHTYIIWLIAFVILFLYSGIRFGFGDLFTSKLIYQNGSVLEVNYIFYTLKMIFVNSIPVLSMVSIMLLFSTITLSTNVTAGIILIVTVLSPWFWQLICQLHLKFLVYTPLPYIDLAQIQEYNSSYLFSLTLVKISQNLGLIVSIITIILCYGISHIVYVKRDIKN